MLNNAGRTAQIWPTLQLQTDPISSLPSSATPPNFSPLSPSATQCCLRTFSRFCAAPSEAEKGSSHSTLVMIYNFNQVTGHPVQLGLCVAQMSYLLLSFTQPGIPLQWLEPPDSSWLCAWPSVFSGRHLNDCRANTDPSSQRFVHCGYTIVRLKLLFQSFHVSRMHEFIVWGY